MKEKKHMKQKKQEKFYNRGAKELQPLKKGDVVRVKPRANQRDSVWEKARVLEQVEERSYKVEMEDRRKYIRNRRHLRLTNETFHRKPVDTETETRSMPSSAQDKLAIMQRNAILQHRPHNANTQVNVNQPPPQPVRYSTRERRQPSYLKDYVQT